MTHALDPLSLDYLADPYPFLARQRAEQPVEFLEAIDMWIVTRHEDAERVFLDNKTFSAGNVQEPLLPMCDAATDILKARFKLIPTTSNLDQPGHSRIRRKLARAFSTRRMKLLTPIIEKRCADLLDELVRDNEMDIAHDLCYPLPAITIFTMIGIPDEDMDQIKEWCAGKLVVNWGRPSEEHQIQAAEAMANFWEYAENFVKQRRADPQDDLTSDLIRDEDEEQPLTDQEIASIIFALSFAGHETTTNQMSNMFRNILENGKWQELRDNRDLMQSYIDESLRYDSSVIAWRRITTCEVAFGDVVLPKGAKIMVALGAANRDPEKFPNPETFDPSREKASDHLSFGKGIHLCLGRTLAYIEMAAMTNVMLDRFETLELVEGQELQFPPNISFRGPQSLKVRGA